MNYLKYFSKAKIRKYLELNKNGKYNTSKFVDAIKALLRERFIALNAYIGKEESSQINNLNFHLEKLLKR